MFHIDTNEGKLYCDRGEWECYSKTPDSTIEEINRLVYAVITTHDDPVVAQKIIYDTLTASEKYGKYGFRDSEGDQCTTNIINKYYGSDIGRWDYLRLAAEKKRDNWAIKIPTETELKEENKEMGLSAKTTQKLASALKEDVIDYIHKDERYVLFMQEVISDAIREKLGQMNEEILFDISTCIMDSICLR